MITDIFLVVIALTLQLNYAESMNFTSPCPRLFNYENNSLEKDKYFGNVRVETREELSGVWLKISFDNPCVQLGVSANHRRYKIVFKVYGTNLIQ